MRTLVVAASTSEVLDRWPNALDLLTPDERTRAAAFRMPRSHDDFVAGHVLIRWCAAEVLACDIADITIVQHCPTCAGPHGPPTVTGHPELSVSLSHTHSHVAAYAGPGPSGVDLELFRKAHVDSLADTVLAPAEAAWVRDHAEPELAFLDLWVRKEALIKAGFLSLNRLSGIDLVGDGDGPADQWQEVHLSGWRGSSNESTKAGTLVGACAAPVPTTVEMLPPHVVPHQAGPADPAPSSLPAD